MRNSSQILNEIRRFKEDIIVAKKCIDKHKSIMSKQTLEEYENEITQSEEKIKLLNNELDQLFN